MPVLGDIKNILPASKDLQSSYCKFISKKHYLNHSAKSSLSMRLKKKQFMLDLVRTSLNA